MPQVENPHEAFALRYRTFVASALDGFEFFGVDPRGIPRRHSFDRGYVPLTLQASARPVEGGHVGGGDRADRALHGVARALVRGIAGAGKSTLLRWLAADSTRVELADGPERPRVPFLLELGRVVGGRPPDLEELVAAPLHGTMPPGWAGRMLADGRVLLLLDGLDEVPPRHRAHIEDWVSELLTAFPGTRCVVTKRPSVVTEQWWIDHGFDVFDLLSMSRHSVAQYVRGWHQVARGDYPGDEHSGREARDWLAQCEDDLLRTLASRPALHGLSSNPLLAGLLCALHLERGEHLPASRKQVYDAALDLLLVRWPEIRRRRARRSAVPGTETETPPETRLEAEEQLKVLQRLAYSLVLNREIAVPRETAVTRVGAMLFGLRTRDEDPATLVRHLSEQSGVVRELDDGSLEFVHRTFRDHLAAREIVEDSHLTLLLDLADKPNWHDVVVMAGAHARPQERHTILCGLLDRARAEREHRDTLTLLAAAVLEQSPVLPDTSASRDPAAEIRAAMASLVPPVTIEEADRLAAAGPFVLSLLPGPDGLDRDETKRVVRTIASVATAFDPPGALEQLLQFVRDPDPALLRQLIIAWGRAADYGAYAREILSGIDFSGRTVVVRNQRRVDHIGHLKSITRLHIKNDAPYLSALAALPRLHRLTIEENMLTDVGAVADLPGLRVLTLLSCRTLAASEPVDLTPLSRSRLDRLVVDGLGGRVHLDGLDGAPLRSLSLSRGGLSKGAPNRIPRLPRLVHLCLRGRDRQVHGYRNVPALRRLVLSWIPSQDECAELRTLRDLRRLTLVGVDPDAALPPLDCEIRLVPGVDPQP